MSVEPPPIPQVLTRLFLHHASPAVVVKHDTAFGRLRLVTDHRSLGHADHLKRARFAMLGLDGGACFNEARFEVERAAS
jgi:hypothetical protein